MQVKLISITQPTFDIDGRVPTPEELVVYIARVSNPSNQANLDTSEGLLSYCIKHAHWSIFEQIDMTVEIETSRAISAQILRHKSFSFQEFSQRYSKVLDFEPIEIRKQAEKNRQSSTKDFDPDFYDDTLLKVGFTKKSSKVINELLQDVRNTYEKLIDLGVAKESARMILPMCTQTKLYMKGSLRSWIHYLDLRTKDDTQKEHREVAAEIKKLFVQQFPIISNALWGTEE